MTGMLVGDSGIFRRVPVVGWGFLAALVLLVGSPAVQGGVVPGGDPSGLLTEDMESFPTDTDYSTIAAAGMSFGEKLDGQTNTPVGDHDVSTGPPNVPLALDATVPSEFGGCFIIFFETVVTHGLGPLGFPDADAIGEGSLAVLYDTPQQVISFDVVGGQNGTFSVQFYNSAGTLLAELIEPAVDGTHTFTSDAQDVKAIVINNADIAGIGYDNFRYELSQVPAVTTWGLSLLALLLVTALSVIVARFAARAKATTA